MLIIPEIILYDTVKYLLDLVRLDTANNKDTPEQSILYRLFYQNDNTGVRNKLTKFDFYEESKTIFNRQNGEQRIVDVHIGYNLERINLPTIHILLPSENQSVENGIGMDEGYIEPITGHDSEGRYYEQAIFSRTLKSTYHLMITSDNSTEAVLIYHFLRAMLISAKNHLGTSGLGNMSFSGQDVNMVSEMIPPNIFHRNLSITFIYEVNTPNLERDIFRHFEVVLKMLPPPEYKTGT